MSRAVVCLGIAIPLVVGTLIVQSDCRGGPPAAKPDAQTATAAAAIPAPTTVEQALDKSVDFNFTDKPLSEIAKSISEQSKINVVLDLRGLSDAGVDPNTPFTLIAKAVPLRAALRMLLATHDLAYIEIGDRVIRITTADIAQARFVVRYYDIQDFAEPTDPYLAKFTPQIKTRESAAAFQQAPQQTAPSVAPAANGHNVPVFLAERDRWDALENVITTVISPSSWDINGGAGTMEVVGSKLVVSQTEEIQNELATMIRGLEVVRQQDPMMLLKSGAEWFQMSQATAQIKAQLNSPTSCNFTDTPLIDIANYFAHKHGISIPLDTKALGDAGVTPDTTFSIKLDQVPLHDALDLLLVQKDLSYVVDHDVLLITTSDVAKVKLQLVMYLVSDLVPDQPRSQRDEAYEKLKGMITDMVEPQSWDVNGGAGSIVPFPLCKVLVVSQTEASHRKIAELLKPLHAAANGNPPAAADESPSVRIYSVKNLLADGNAGGGPRTGEALIEMIRKLVAPETWNGADKFIGMASGALVVRQSESVHRQIQNLLDGIDMANETKNAAGAPPKPTAPAGLGAAPPEPPIK